MYILGKRLEHMEADAQQGGMQRCTSMPEVVVNGTAASLCCGTAELLFEVVELAAEVASIEL